MSQARSAVGPPRFLVGVLTGALLVGIPVAAVRFLSGGRPETDRGRGEAGRPEEATRPEHRAPTAPAPRTEAVSEVAVEGRAGRTGGERRFLGLVKKALSGKAEGGEAEGEAPEAAQSVLLDAAAPIGDRRRAAWILARRGDQDSLDALAEALAGGPAALRSAIAEALGHSPSPVAKEILLGLLSSEEDEGVLRGAVRGIAALGGDEAAEILARTLRSEERSVAVREEAAEALGEVKSPRALAALLEAYESARGADPELAASAIAGLGKRDFAETRRFFEALLDSPGADRELRVTALEALGEATGDAGRFLLGYLGDADSEVRAAAAWSLATLEEPGQLSAELLGVLEREEDPDVRARIYQALENQPSAEDAAVLRRVLAETDPGLRLLASPLAAEAAARGTGREEFDAALVPELAGAALGPGDVQAKLRAVYALKRARTPRAVEALREIAGQSAEARVAEAARAAVEMAR